MLRTLMIGVWLACVWAWAPAVSAQDLRAVRLRFDPTLFALDFSSTTLDVEVPSTRPGGPTMTSRIESNSATTEVGLFSNDVAFGIGGSFNDRINAGVTLLLSYRSTSSKVAIDGMRDPDTTVSQGTVWIVPYVELAPPQQGPVRPFISLHAGLGTTSATDDTGKAHTGVGGIVALGGGIHYFVNEYLSIDPHLHVGYHGGTAGDVSVTGWTVAGVLGVSAWFGSVKRASVTVSPVTASPTTTTDASIESAGAAAPTESAPPSTPAPTAPVTEARERIALSDAWVELYVARDQPDSITLTLDRPRASAQDQQLSCGRLTVIAGGTRTDVATHDYRQRQDQGAREQVVSDVTISVVRTLVDGNQRLTAIDACNQRHYLTSPQRNALRTFIERRDAMVPPPPAAEAASPATLEAPAATPTPATESSTPVATPSTAPAVP